MDPNEALKNMRAKIERLRELQGRFETTSPSDIEEAANDLADAAEAIDGWISKGGFLPLAWSHAPRV